MAEEENKQKKYQKKCYQKPQAYKDELLLEKAERGKKSG